MQVDSIWIVFGMALVTYATRSGGLWLIEHITLTTHIQKWLRHIPGAILVSIVTPMIVESNFAELVAVIITIFVGINSKNILLTMIVGIAAILAARHFL